MAVVHTGDCIEVMAGMGPESVDAIVTDPPYNIGFMGKAWDSGHGHGPWATAAYRVAKPSAYLLAFGGTRTVHRMTVALEDAGWIIRDMLVWAYASGFPKSKASLKPAWEPIVMARKPGPLRMLAIDACRIGPGDEVPGGGGWAGGADGRVSMRRESHRDDLPTEPHTLGRWPANIVLTDPILEGVVGGDREVLDVWPDMADGLSSQVGATRTSDSLGYSRFFLIPKADRSDREPVLGGLERAGSKAYGAGKGTPVRECRVCGNRTKPPGPNVEWPACGHGDWQMVESYPLVRVNDHPTVKPTDLMRHLVRLVTPTGGTVLDPFLGSGSTGIAAEMEGFEWIGIEKEEEYVKIAEARLNGTQRGLAL